MQKKDSVKYWSMPLDAVLQHFHSAINGLTSEDAELRLKEYGENSIKEQKKISQLMLFINQFKNPIIIILIIATVISAATGEWIDATIILLILFASAILSLLQEYSASNAVEELRAKV